MKTLKQWKTGAVSGTLVQMLYFERDWRQFCDFKQLEYKLIPTVTLDKPFTQGHDISERLDVIIMKFGEIAGDVYVPHRIRSNDCVGTNMNFSHFFKNSGVI